MAINKAGFPDEPTPFNEFIAARYQVPPRRLEEMRGKKPRWWYLALKTVKQNKNKQTSTKQINSISNHNCIGRAIKMKCNMSSTKFLFHPIDSDRASAIKARKMTPDSDGSIYLTVATAAASSHRCWPVRIKHEPAPI